MLLMKTISCGSVSAELETLLRWIKS